MSPTERRKEASGYRRLLNRRTRRLTRYRMHTYNEATVLPVSRRRESWNQR